MNIKNISDGDFNLASGVVKPGDTGDATLIECRVLFSSNKCEEVKVNVAPKVKK